MNACFIYKYVTTNSREGNNYYIWNNEGKVSTVSQENTTASLAINQSIYYLYEQ